ncbi:Uncharacterized conserved protein YbbC, DUF1343 family [Marininema mesophilum]|uniref:Uncharacterized conserved protein YbbC, DUF1343 family n=1 Tax=Marininema mesophilum TaxID=1048340 RepID=A0A1H2X1F6_9BACL|nr:DUF1343 domain-containing protein [Marininema mesophilum]SDW86672.1 Uncharacterized conserved protein YbbC, DUF1343 family [Marininema mesophilum]
MKKSRWAGLLAMLMVLGLMGTTGVSGKPEHIKNGVKTGLQILLENPSLVEGKKVGLITNPTGITSSYEHGLDAMLRQGINVVKVYGPEHGVRGTEQAGDTPGSFEDPRTGLPFINLYGKQPQEMIPLFSGVDVLVFDIQDVGTRYYTYIYTMAYAMEAAAQAGKPFVVLDRPNPIGGTRIEGPVLDPAYSSFVGLYPIPQRHGMTVGELAQMFRGEFLTHKPELQVIRMKRWHRKERYTDTDLPWVPPSPNMPTLDTALVYSGTGMIEGTNLSEGRGSTRPFELLGAPYIKGWEWAEELNKAKLPGVSFREAAFTPTFSKYQGQTVTGVQVYVTDSRIFRPTLTGLTILETVKRLYPKDFAWRKDGDSYWIDKLTGSDRVRKGIDAGESAKTIEAKFNRELDVFKIKRATYLLYR